MRQSASFKKVVELDPKNAQAYFQLARAYQKNGDGAAAQAALEKYEKYKEK